MEISLAVIGCQLGWSPGEVRSRGVAEGAAGVASVPGEEVQLAAVWRWLLMSGAASGVLWSPVAWHQNLNINRKQITELNNQQIKKGPSMEFPFRGKFFKKK